MEPKGLGDVVPLKQAPVDTSGVWEPVERRLGTPLPIDYRHLIETYGTGCFDDFLWVFNPFSSNPHLNLFTQVEARLAALRQLQTQHGSAEVAYPLHPTPGGLLPWGMSDNGDVLYWLTMGAPSEWTVVINAARDSRTEHHPMSATDFLVRVLSKRIASKLFPDDFPSDEPAFRVGS